MDTIIGSLIGLAFLGLLVWRIVDRIKNASRANYDHGPDF